MTVDERLPGHSFQDRPTCGSQEAATLFGLGLALGGLVAFAGVRWAFGLDEFQLSATTYLRAGGLAVALLLAPHAARSGGGPIAFLIFLAPLAGLIFLRGTGAIAIDLIVVSIVVAGGMPFLRALSRIPPGRVAAIFATGAGSAILVLNVLLARRYATPLSLEMSLVGANHHDTVFHAAVAQMIEAYGVVSIGADGLVPLGYHVLSHRVIAGFAAWSGADTLSGYGLFVPVVGVPMMLGLLAQVATRLRGWAAHPVGQIGDFLIPVAVLALGGAAMWNSYYVSESYTLSLWFLLWAAGLMGDAAWQRPGASQAGTLLLIALAIALASLSKISTGAVLSCAVIAGLSALWRFRPSGLVIATAAGGLPFVAVFLLFPMGESAGASLLRPFAFFDYPEPAIYAGVFALVLSGLALRRFPTEPRRRSLVLALVAGMWAGVGSSYLVNVAGGSQFYFSDPGTWLGLLLIPVLGMAPRSLSSLSPARRLTALGAAVLVLLALNEPTTRGLQWIAQTPEQLAPLQQGDQDDTVALAIARLISARGAGDLNVDGIMVDPGYAAFWALQDTCWAGTFLLPAVLGVPMLRGLPPDVDGCTMTPNYGFSGYDWSDSRAQAIGLDTEICALARLRDMSRVLVVSTDPPRQIDCDPAASPEG